MTDPEHGQDELKTDADITDKGAEFYQSLKSADTYLNRVTEEEKSIEPLRKVGPMLEQLKQQLDQITDLPQFVSNTINSIQARVKDAAYDASYNVGPGSGSTPESVIKYHVKPADEAATTHYEANKDAYQRQAVQDIEAAQGSGATSFEAPVPESVSDQPQ